MSKPASSVPEKKQPSIPHVPVTHKPMVETSASKSTKGGSPLPGGCNAQGCKSAEKRFSFCSEHYDQFKFGLIKKTGEPVSDHEKKLEHYQAYKARLSTQKAA